MLSIRLRRLVPAVPFIALAVALAAAAPSFAADSMRILSPLSGTTVSGDVLVDGTITTSDATELTVGLAPQNLGECGSLVAERSTTVAASSAFSFTVSTALLPDGLYCVIAIAAGGALSHVVGDVTLANGIDDVNVELPTLSIDSPAPPADGSAIDAAGDPLVEISSLAPVVFAATGVLGMLVLVFTYVARRRLTE